MRSHDAVVKVENNYLKKSLLKSPHDEECEDRMTQHEALPTSVYIHNQTNIFGQKPFRGEVSVP